MENEQQWRSSVVTVLVTEASKLNCQLIEQVFRQKRAHVDVVGSAIRSRDVVALLKQTDPDVAVISAQLEDGPLEGYRVLRELHSLQSRTRSILLLGEREHDLVIDAFRCGARGVVFRDEPLEILGKCIHAVHHGQVWANSENLCHILETLSRAMPSARVRGANGVELLSKRETDVARLVTEGLTNREISAQLGLSPHTIKNYVFRVFEKLGVSTRVELVLYCYQERQARLLTAHSDEAEPRTGTKGA
ncbi:MAG: response regulator transcription factor [Acidobacteriia bacterium]|nr:response regulator transcription factor [Terriglobia bacterium]